MQIFSSSVSFAPTSAATSTTRSQARAPVARTERAINVAQIFSRSIFFRAMNEIIFATDSETDDLERTEIHLEASVALAARAGTFHRTPREVDEARDAPFAEVEDLFLGIRGNAESPRHVAVFAIEARGG